MNRGGEGLGRERFGQRVEHTEAWKYSAQERDTSRSWRGSVGPAFQGGQRPSHEWPCLSCWGVWMWTLECRDTRKDLPARDGTSCGLGRDHAWQQHDRRIKEGQEPSSGAVGTIRARREGLAVATRRGQDRSVGVRTGTSTEVLEDRRVWSGGWDRGVSRTSTWNCRLSGWRCDRRYKDLLTCHRCPDPVHFFLWDL